MAAIRTDEMRDRIAAYAFPRGGVEVVRASRGYTLYSRRTDGCCATIKTPRPATICHTSDGGAAFGGQAGVKPEAARGGGPKGQALHQLDGRTS
jgi:hypothetical protein